MKVLIGSFWDIGATFRCITTNGVVRKNGKAVMGKGIALEAVVRCKLMHPSIDVEALLGYKLSKHGNHVYMLEGTGLISFPTKYSWRDDSSISLIEQSCKELIVLVQPLLAEDSIVVLPAPGCGNGHLDWRQVKCVIEQILVDDRYIVVFPPNTK
jgi:hypothetical protein